MKTPDSRQAMSGVGEQLHLIEPPPFSPTRPARATLAARALECLLRGETLTHPEFEKRTRSWRLAEPIRALRHEHGWPVEALEIHCPTEEHPNRTIARYYLPSWVIEAVGGIANG
jgi:hypothetical protein